jgi:hypothetical protein
MVLIGSATAAEHEQSTRGWRFVEETVGLEVIDGRFTVEANYVFSPGPASESLALLLPFPADESLGQPRLLNALITRDGKTLPLDVLESPDGWRFMLGASGSGRHVVHLAYDQPMTDARAIYTLTSLQEWGRPLARAFLEVRVPEGRECRITPALTAVGPDMGKQVFRGTFENWLPKEDLVVQLVNE